MLLKLMAFISCVILTVKTVHAADKGETKKLIEYALYTFTILGLVK